MSVAAASGLQAATSFAFSSQASDPDGDALTYAWDFADGTPGAGASSAHVFMSSGSFTVKLTVSDGRLSATGQTSVTVKNVTGVWMKPWTTGPCNAANRLSLMQVGGSFTGVYEAVQLSGDCSAVGLGTGPLGVNGTIGGGSPTLTWTIDTQSTTRFEGSVNGDVTSIEVTSCTIRLPPLTDICTRQVNFWDPLTRQ